MTATPKEFPFYQTPVTTPKETIQSPMWSPSVAEQPIVTGNSRPRHRESSSSNTAIPDSQDFVETRDRLASCLDSTTSLVKRLQSFNQDKWTIVYPHELGLNASPSQPARSSTAPSTPNRIVASRSSSTFDGRSPSDSEQPRPTPPQRSYSTVETPAKAAVARSDASTSAEPAHPLSILALDLKLGHPAANVASLPALLPSLSVSTLSQLLSRRLTTSTSHLSQLKARVLDKRSRILVTGDLNAGKSTFVNALLRREIMPYDQQPCTTVFCECLDASLNNNDKQEIHAVRDVSTYDVDDSTTYDTFPLDKLNEFQDTPDEYQILKAYVKDARSNGPSEESEDGQDAEDGNESFIANGIVQTSLIDAPGLNRDTLSTTALFARQSEIDVIVFVVSAENHFTLSAKEFLWNAAREKAYIFIVVNKWSGIRDKARCMRVVGEQIKQLSPATWEDRNELVHFVDAAEVLRATDNAVVEPSFDKLESSLRSFVLLKRSQSKLAPARHYLLNLLSDLLVLTGSNRSVAEAEKDSATDELERVKPVHERLVSQRQHVDDAVDAVEESTVTAVKTNAWRRVDKALAAVSRGQLITNQDTTASALSGAEMPIAAPTELPAYPGLFDLWSWASDVKRTFVRAIEADIRIAEDEARAVAADKVAHIVSDISQQYLPQATVKDGEQAVEQTTERQFQPQAMFAKRRRGSGRLAARGLTSGLGLGVGLSRSQPSLADEFEISFFDLFDVERFVPSWGSKQVDDDALETGALISLGIGGIGMLGSRMIGIKGGLESLTRIFDVLGSPAARKWAGPVLGIFAAGLAVYVVVDLPRAVPVNVGRRLAIALDQQYQSATSLSAGSNGPPATFATAQADRIATETRKVLRLASWDLRERYRAALDRSAAERKAVEEKLARANVAIEWLDLYERDVLDETQRVSAVELAN